MCTFEDLEELKNLGENLKKTFINPVTYIKLTPKKICTDKQ